MIDLKKISGANIVTHGDGDGTIAAAVVKKSGADGRVTVTQPFLLHKLPDLSGPTVILDIAVDTRSPEATVEWARRNAEHIVAWVDHHAGGEALVEVLGDKFIYDPEAPSCPALMAEHGFSVPAEWLDAANACDRPTEFSATPLSERYNAAFKVALVEFQAGDRSIVAKIQQAFIAELVDGEEQSELVSEYASRYPALDRATNEVVDNITELVPGVGVVEVPEGQASVDVTQVMMRGYKKFPVVVILTTSAEDGRSLALIGTAHKPDTLNLVELFGLGSGNPSRVVLTGTKIFTVSEVLRNR